MWGGRYREARKLRYPQIVGLGIQEKSAPPSTEHSGKHLARAAPPIIFTINITDQ